MEAREGMNTGVTVIGAEAPSAYHVAPRTETPSQNQAAGSPALTAASPVSVELAGTTGKKKRGRPRKYGPDGTVTMALSPMPISSSAPPGGDLSATKRGKVRPSGLEYKQHKKVGMQNFGEWNACSVGTNFLPHIITVNAGEDVTMKVISFSQQGPRAICILSANGVISNVTLRQPDSSGGTLTYEVVVGSFLPSSNQHEQKPKKPKNESIPAIVTPATTIAAMVPAFNAENDEGLRGNGQQNSSTPRPNLGFQRENWPIMHTVQDYRNSGTDINISLPGG
ncbi:AT-hook motif nuclear-localized protein 1-like isoform X2 [Carya illinoinensis]|uniref:AT-hook motif nuclear-localized protein 1-like isoform X2 n=1 Tax=Carya illinoinensis TaxID=32201 RepID=UPI001C726DE9|nr:AT-hook motif nuclear-localized protein 1-like isoform X2 [Carya illinoinensis]